MLVIDHDARRVCVAREVHRGVGREARHRAGRPPHAGLVRARRQLHAIGETQDLDRRRLRHRSPVAERADVAPARQVPVAAAPARVVVPDHDVVHAGRPRDLVDRRSRHALLSYPQQRTDPSADAAAAVVAERDPRRVRRQRRQLPWRQVATAPADDLAAGHHRRKPLVTVDGHATDDTGRAVRRRDRGESLAAAGPVQHATSPVACDRAQAVVLAIASSAASWRLIGLERGVEVLPARSVGVVVVPAQHVAGRAPRATAGCWGWGVRRRKQYVLKDRSHLAWSGTLTRRLRADPRRVVYNAGRRAPNLDRGRRVPGDGRAPGAGAGRPARSHARCR